MRNIQPQVDSQLLNEMYHKNRVFLVHSNSRIEQYMKKSYRELYLILYSIKNTNSLKSKIPRLEDQQIMDKTIFSKDVSKLIKKYEGFLSKLKLEYKDNVNQVEKRKPSMTNSLNIDELLQNQKSIIPVLLKTGSHVEQVRYQKQLEDSIKQLAWLYKFYEERENNKIRTLFAEHARIMALDMKFTVFLPTILKTTLLKINSLDLKNRLGDLRIKLKLKIFIPGFNNFPDMYEKMLKKLKIRLRIQKNAWESEDNFIDFSKSTKIYKNLKEYCSEDHRLNDLERKIWLKNYGDEFQGVIISTQIPHMIVQMVGDTRTSPFEMFDLRGIIELLPITTSIEDWQKSIFIQDEGLRKFFMTSAPNILLKLNLISLYKQKVFFEDLTQVNHINSKHEVKIETFELAAKKMFLQINDNQKSNYNIERVRRKLYSYEWVENKSDQKQPSKQLKQAMKTKMQKYLTSQTTYKNQMEMHKKIFEKLVQHEKLKNNRQEKQKQNQHQIFLQDSSSQQQIIKQITNIEKQLALFNDYYYPKQKWQLQKYRPKSKIQLENIERYYYIKVSEEQEEEVLDLLKEKLMSLKKTTPPLHLNQAIFNQQREVNDRKKQALDEIANLDWNNQQIPKSQYEYIIDRLSDSQAHFHFPIFNDPGLLILSSFFLIVLQGISVLFLFFHTDSMFGLLIAATQGTVGLIKVVKDLQTDVLKRRFSIFEFVANLILITPLLFIFDSVYEGYLARQKRVYQNLLFYISVIITSINLIVPCFFYLNHEYIEKKKYTDPQLLSVSNKKILKYNIMPGSKQIKQHFQDLKGKQYEGVKIESKNVEARVMECIVDYLKTVFYLRIKIKNSPEYLYESIHKHFNKKINYMNTIMEHEEQVHQESAKANC